MQEIWVQSLGQEDPLEEGMATHSSILAWEIPWTQEPGRLHSMGVTESNKTEHTHYTNVIYYMDRHFSHKDREHLKR